MTSIPAKYESFLVMNASTIGTIESSLRSLTWFLPGRFKDAEIVGEALNSTLNLLSLYHDTLLARRLALVKSTNPKTVHEIIPPSTHTRYTRGWSQKDSLYKWSARGLEVLRFTQLVIEMLLKRFTGRNGRWRGIFLLELAKALFQLALLQRTKRPVLSPPIPERDVDPTALPALADAQTQSPPLKPITLPSPNEDAENTGTRPVPSHLSNNHVPFKPTEEYLLPKALTPTTVRPPTTLLHPLQNLAHLSSEIIYILRPLIYVLMLRPTNSNRALIDGKSSTSINYNVSPVLNSLRTPLAISIFLSILSRYLRRQPPASPSSFNSLERQEYARRDRELFWYLFRGEMWTGWTRPKLDNLSKSLEGKPLLGLVAGIIQGWVPLVDEYWYYTAT